MLVYDAARGKVLVITGAEGQPIRPMSRLPDGGSPARRRYRVRDRGLYLRRAGLPLLGLRRGVPARGREPTDDSNREAPQDLGAAAQAAAQTLAERARGGSFTVVATRLPRLGAGSRGGSLAKLKSGLAICGSRDLHRSRRTPMAPFVYHLDLHAGRFDCLRVCSICAEGERFQRSAGRGHGGWTSGWWCVGRVVRNARKEVG